MPARRKRFLTSCLIVAASLMLLVYIVYKIAYNYPKLSDLAPLPLAGHAKLLVLAPHCDDEVLGAAGAMLAAERMGMDVRVVIATNGDGYQFATMEEFRQAYPTAEDFIRMGNIRQQESLDALQVLGIQPEQVLFLSYPDRGSAALLSENWQRDNPYLSPYSESRRSPYWITYNPNSVYAGEDYLADLKSILDEYRPDLILYPHPDDVHGDHWGLGALARLAAASVEQEAADYKPDLFAYLVHRRDFPSPKVYNPEMELLPPRRSYEVDPVWYRLDLAPQDVALKDQAVTRYTSQLKQIGYLMRSFVRQDEPFAQPEPARLARLASGDPSDPTTWRDAQGDSIQPVQRDPNRDFITREMFGATDLEITSVALDPQNQLLYCARFRGETKDVLLYSLQVIEIGAQGVIHHNASNHNLQPGWHELMTGERAVCDRIQLSVEDPPWALLVGANVGEVGAGVLDQIGWQMVNISPEN